MLAAPVPELAGKAWLERCAFPVGMSDSGRFWPLEDSPSAPGGQVPAAQPAKRSPRDVKRSRYLGCLLGGAVGDALGYPVEFLKESAIWDKYGPEGIQTLEQAGSPARISDDTQMTLFAANAIVYAQTHGAPLAECLWTAYREWLGTQGDKSRMDDPAHPQMWVYRDPRMHALRAPGNACLQAIRTSPRGGTLKQPVNHSKGCGTVMRAAPFGLAKHYDPAFSRGDDFVGVHRMAAMDAALTHGHMLAWASSSLLAQILFEIVQQRPEHTYRLEEAVSHAGFPGDTVLHPLLERAVKLALTPAVSDLEGVHALGEGWVAEEALAIAVFCAVRYQDDFAAALRAAVNHKGDSDSTGAICGNILGAWLGEEAVAAAFDLNRLELRDVVEKMAGQLFDTVEGPDAPAAPPKPEAPKKEAPKPESPKTARQKPLRPVGLTYTYLTKKALRLCFAAHGRQTDKSGMPYVIHPLHLAEQMETEEEVCTALLHDVAEDSPYTLEDLAREGFPERVLEALRLLTRDKSVPYLDYVAALRKNPLARQVKTADLRHNSDLSRLDAVTVQDRRRALKYRMALAVLEDDGYDAALGHFRKRIPLSLEHPLFLSVFYDTIGEVREYSIDVETAADSHYTFDAQQGERLRRALDKSRTLPEALADWAAQSYKAGRSVEGLLGRLGVTYQPFHGD